MALSVTVRLATAELAEWRRSNDALERMADAMEKLSGAMAGEGEPSVEFTAGPVREQH